MHTNDFPSPEDLDSPQFGDIRVNLTVVASIVRLATLQVPGVSGVGGRLVDGIAEFFSAKESDRGVKVDESPDGRYRIEIRLVVTYGSEIGKTALDVQLAVRQQVTAMTGKSVDRVDVIVEGVKLPLAAKPAVQETEESEWGVRPVID